MSELTEVTLVIHCHNPPAVAGTQFNGVRLGIQFGKEVIEDVVVDGADVLFRAPIRLKQLPDGSPDFAGPYVQGPRDERFVYLNWGYRHLSAWTGVRRAKLQLRDLPRELLSQPEVHVWVDMTDAKGGPLCASVKSGNLRWG